MSSHLHLDLWSRPGAGMLPRAGMIDSNTVKATELWPQSSHTSKRMGDTLYFKTPRAAYKSDILVFQGRDCDILRDLVTHHTEGLTTCARCSPDA